MQEPKLLSQESNIHGVDTGDVATRVIEARHETSLNRVGAARVHNRNGRGRSFGHERRCYAARCYDDGHWPAY